MFNVTNELQKTTIFFIIDIIAVLVFTWLWFKYYDKNEKKKPFDESLKFTIAMQIYFFAYYFLFDSFWEYMYRSD